MKKFSIITICLNMEREIQSTIDSVLNQTCMDFEYIIKDGGSEDKTVSIAQSFASAFEEKGIPFRILVRPDTGIYDAMNQSVSEANGEWINFMNAGDCFANETVLEYVVKSGYLETADIIYGDRIMRRQNQYCYLKAKPLEHLRIGQPFCHQSTFSRRALLVENPFSLEYHVCSDYRFFLQAYREEKIFAYLPEALSIYDVTGVSSNGKKNSQERYDIVRNMPVRDEEAIQQLREILKRKSREEFLYQHLWRYIPEKLRMRRREHIRKSEGWKTEEEFFGTKKDRP